MEEMDRRNREQNERIARQQREERKLQEQRERDRLEGNGTAQSRCGEERRAGSF